VLEALWIAAGRTTPHARFVRGIILVAAACLNRHREKPGGGKRQAAVGVRSLESLLPADDVFMGLSIPPFVEGVRACFERGAGPPAILLQTGKGPILVG
jgi:hypothetical protein